MSKNKEREEDNHPLIEDNESQSLCKERSKILLPILLALVIGTNILIVLFGLPSRIKGMNCDINLNIAKYSFNICFDLHYFLH